MTVALRPSDLAKRWQCSERTIRMLLRNGFLPTFRIGGKLLRVPLAAVEAYEKCYQDSDASFTEDGITPSGAKTEPNAAKRFAPNVVSLPSKR